MRLRAVLLVAVVATGLTVGVSPSAQAASGCPGIFSASFVHAIEHEYPGVRVTASVYDTRRGCWSHLHPGMEITTASVIKAQVLGAVLLQAQSQHRSLTAWERSQIGPMIRYSSNDETSTLYEHVGGTVGMHATDAGFGATHTTHVRPFGLTRSTAVDRTNVALRLLYDGGNLTQASREEAWSYMTNVHPLQQWGITAGVPNGWRVGLKNGFYPASGLGWRVGSSGFVRQDDADQGYTLAIMTEGAGTQAAAIAIVERVSRQVAAALTIGPPASRPIDRARCTTTSGSESWSTVTARLGLPSSRAGEVKLTSGNNPSPLGGQRACSPSIPAEPTDPLSIVNVRYRVVASDLDCDGRDDLLFYQPGPGADYLWHGRANRRFAAGSAPSQSIDAVPIAGDFDGDGCGDVLFHGFGTHADEVWFGGATISRRAITINGRGYDPTAADLDGDGRTDIIWYAPGSRGDSIWFGRADRTFSSESRTLTLPYEPVVADVDGNGADDVVWYARGTDRDPIWYGQVGRRQPAAGSVNVTLPYRATAADLDGDGDQSLLWYAPGPAADWIWEGAPPSSSTAITITRDYLPIPGDFDGDGAEDIAWYGPGGLPDVAWWGSSTGPVTSGPLRAA